MKNKWLIGLAAVVLIGALGSFYIAGNSAYTGADGGSYLEDGKNYVAKGDLASAVIQLKNAVRDDPENAEVRQLLGQTYIRIGNFPSAEKELRAAARLGIGEEKLVVDLAQAYVRQGKFSDVLTRIRSGERDPLIEGKILGYHGLAYIGLNKMEKAEEALQKALTLAPNEPNNHLGMAVLFQMRKDLAAAEKSVDQALANDPDFVQALGMKGRLRRNAGDIDGAMIALDKTVELDRENLTARLGRAAINIGRNEDEKARQDIDAVTSRAENHPIAAYLNAMLLSKEKKNSEAIVLLQGMGDFIQNYPPGLYLLAYLQLQENQAEQAELNLLALLTLVPEETTATRLLAGIYLRKNQPQKAIEVLRVIVTDDTQDADLLSLLASAHLRAGNAEEAARLFETVAKSRPDDPNLKTRLALTRIQSGKTETAIAELRGILETNPDASRAHILLVLTELRQNNLDAALEAAQNLKKNLKDHPLPDNLLGGIWLRKGDIAKARESFEAALTFDGKFIPSLMNLAQISISEGKFPDAVANYLKIIAIDNKNIAAMTAMSRMAFAVGDSENGIGWLKRAIVQQPEAPEPRLRLVNHYLAAKNSSEASIVARNMLQSMPDNVLAVDAMGRAQMASKQFASATSSYRTVVKLAPDSPAAHVRLALALAAVKNLDDARRAFAVAIKLAPDYIPAHLGLIRTEISEKNYDIALVLAESLRERFPKRSVADLAIGDIRLSMGRYIEAAESYERAGEIVPSSKATMRVFHARLLGKQEKIAVAGMKTWLEKNARDQLVRFTLASHFLNKGDFDQALAEHETLYKFEPENQIVLNNLAWLYDRKGDKRALELATKALTKDVRSPTIKDTLGWIMLRRGDAERGRELIADAAKALTDNAEVQYHYAYALNTKGEKALARAVLEKHLAKGVRHFPEIEDARALLRSIQ